MRIFKFCTFASVALGAFMQMAAAADPETAPDQKSASQSQSKPPDSPISPSPAGTAAPIADPDSPDAGICGLFNCCVPLQWHLLAGVGLYAMEAHYDSNMAYGIQGTANRSTGPIPPGSAGTRVAERVDIDQHMVVAPQVWLGFLSDDGLGARVRYWYFREGTNQAFNGGSGTSGTVNSTLIFSAAPLGLSLINGTSTMVATSKLQLQVVDAEGMLNLNAAKWDILFSGGVRFAQIDQAYNAFVPQRGDNTLLSSNTFSGAGPTLALELHRPICSCLSLYGTVRYSLVFGSGQQQASIPDQNAVAQDLRHVGIGIAELELGLEYKHVVGRYQLFGQLAVVGQNWSGAGSASRSSVNVLPGGAFIGAAYTGDSDINFLGLAARIGVNY
jgi:hypothetical protein